MLERLMYFTLGTIAGPILRGIARPIAVGVVRGGLTITRAVEGLAEEARTSVSEIHAEAVREVTPPARRGKRATA